MFCRYCGKANKDTSIFCESCGKKMARDHQAEFVNKKSSQMEDKKKSGFFTKVIIGFGAVCIVACVCTVVVISLFTKDNGIDTGSGQNMGDAGNSTSSEERVVSDDSKDREIDGGYSFEDTAVEQDVEAVPDYNGVKKIDSYQDASEICEEMDLLSDVELEEDELLYSIANAALQVERKHERDGKNQKLYSNLGSEEELDLVYELLYNFPYYNSSSKQVMEDIFSETDNGVRINTSVAEDFFEDCYGGLNADLSDLMGYEEYGDGTFSSSYGDGDPWYAFLGYSVKENDDFYMLEGPCNYEDNGGCFYPVGYAKYLFQKNEESSFGMTLVYSEFTHDENSNLAISARASSTLPNAHGKSYNAGNVLDNSFNNCWVEGKNGTGVGEKITLDLGERKKVYGVFIYNGYLASKYLYEINGKVVEVAVEADGAEVTSSLYIPDYYDEVDEPFSDYDEAVNPTWIKFEKPVITDRITVRILDAVRGSKYDDTCISRIQVY